MNIGDWVQRSRVNAAGTVTAQREGKVHHVDSIVAGEAVTTCGNRMARQTEHGRLTPMPFPLVDDDICELCDKGAVIRPERGGTAPELPPAPVVSDTPDEEERSAS